MQDDPIQFDEHVAEIDLRAEKKLYKIFYCSTILCVLILFHLFLVTGAIRSQWLLQTSLLPVLLWSVIVTAYSFHSLWLVAQDRRNLLLKLAERDTQTGVYSEAYLRERLMEVRDVALKTGQVAAFAHIQLIGLDTVREKYGYTAANIVMKDIARIMLEAVHAPGIVARLAGEEFAALFSQTAPKDAIPNMDRVLTGIREYRLDLGARGTISGLDASIGVAAYPWGATKPGDVTQTTQALSERTQRETGVHLLSTLEERLGPEQIDGEV